MEQPEHPWSFFHQERSKGRLYVCFILKGIEVGDVNPILDILKTKFGASMISRFSPYGSFYELEVKGTIFSLSEDDGALTFGADEKNEELLFDLIDKMKQSINNK